MGTRTDQERRAARRVRGPFDAERVGLLNLKLRIYDLSAGGCLIDSLSEVSTEHSLRLRIELPDGNMITVRGQVMLPPRDIGYAVRFVDLDAPTRDMIERAIDYLETERLRYRA
jgi:hypothetical protein